MYHFIHDIVRLKVVSILCTNDFKCLGIPVLHYYIIVLLNTNTLPTIIFLRVEQFAYCIKMIKNEFRSSIM